MHQARLRAFAIADPDLIHADPEPQHDRRSCVPSTPKGAADCAGRAACARSIRMKCGLDAPPSGESRMSLGVVPAVGHPILVGVGLHARRGRGAGRARSALPAPERPAAEPVRTGW